MTAATFSIGLVLGWQLLSPRHMARALALCRSILLVALAALVLAWIGHAAPIWFFAGVLGAALGQYVILSVIEQGART